MQLRDNDDFVYPTIETTIETTLLATGAEGKVYLAIFKRPRYMYDSVVIKEINLTKIRNKKNISQLVLNSSPDNLYRLFLSEHGFNKPSFTEIICQTLTNQLVFQHICPHFSLNFYWDFVHKNQELILYTINEYANFQDFHQWARKQHSFQEWLNALFQIMVGLSCLNRYFDMIHSDFHTGNILVQKVPPGGYWVYTIDNFKYYLPNLGFVLLIHDFGFAWIPNKLIPVDFHCKETLRYITRYGRHYYDLQCIIEFLFDSGYKYKVPEAFRKLINTQFPDDELEYVLSRRYYQRYPDHYSEILTWYPNIKTDYKGTGTTLADKIYQIFYNNEATTLRHKPINGLKIENYSLDKAFNKDKLPINLRRLLR
uniref:Protein kinase domain-containing protein n=1 Tax=viral metagenome TaxID=1070528 RepID=A0A6C0H6T6_9ZZZZ